VNIISSDGSFTGVTGTLRSVIFLINLQNIPEILPATFRSQFSIP
jgi:hypothetical protein